MGNILLASIVYYGLEMKIHNTRSNIALIATSIHLLMNGSQVLKNILKETINFETFFDINLLPFLEIIDKNQIAKRIKKETKNYEEHGDYEIIFDNIILSEPGQIKFHALNLRIKEGENVFIYEPN